MTSLLIGIWQGHIFMSVGLVILPLSQRPTRMICSYIIAFATQLVLIWTLAHGNLGIVTIVMLCGLCGLWLAIHRNHGRG